MKTRLLRALGLLCAAVLLLGACGRKDDTAAPAQPSAGTLRVIAGSELKDVERELKADIRKATGVELAFVYSGTLDAIDRLASGESFDAVWVSHGKYLAMNPALKDRIKAQEKTMLSPVILGVKESRAKELGWDRKDPTWKDVSDAARSGRLTFGMTNPTASNTGFTATIGLAAALAKNPDALTDEDVKNPQISAFFKGQTLTAGSSGWLAEAYAREQGKVDALINYESVLLSMNRGNELSEKLTLVYPNEGIITADYPLMLLDQARRADYDKLVAYLRSKDFQTRLSAVTLRRPVNTDATAAPEIPKRTLVELPFPGQPAVIDALLDNFLAEVRIPGVSRYVLDVSGSMRGQRIDSLKEAMRLLTGDGSGGLANRAARFQNRETIGILAFSGEPKPTRVFAMGRTPEQHAKARADINAYVDSMVADGGTAIFSSVRRALLELAAEKASAKEGRYYTVVLMTDGENTAGMGMDDFKRWHGSQSEGLRSIRVFPILFGEAKPAEMQALAELTGGQVFDSKSKTLAAVFKEIRGYQ